ncbi:Mannosylfructose-phosphate synthase [Candidatus Ornithobacterium hominis]|uniref:Mannosylfructose-phosphate synthase n=1 Tax=Candidatus Ornithobacterium hominis TaxID=2497989 RepID=A0A383TVL5_9FLAO|nr:glycosyltransferase [Candidatus Ornithobacterium hominis]MCT7904491.1 glycosyltransferase [Candidatus Ornithobacterium hominis]CAI9430276.1 Mannosylfructose-phosphate synthase [Candidatus Ornithobacterium hominis]SZD71387.1 Mannosylfructose-phosphate synthase [Candidatus Ornithobacterium hominis]
MKILQVINNLYTGGAEKLILDTIPLYRKQGIEMDLAVLQDGDFPFMKALEETQSCKIYKIGKRSVYSPLLILPLAKIMKNYDIIHVHLFPAQYFAVIANQINGNSSKLIFTEHNTSNRRIRNKIFKPLEIFIYSRYQKIICITEEIKNIINKYVNVPEERLPVIENGVDLNKIYKAESKEKSEIHSSLTHEDVLITQVSAFRLQKDQPTVIRAMQLLPQNYKLFLVGDGKQRKNCEDLVKKLNLEKRVFFLGERNDVPKLLKSSDFIVLSSHFEGLSLSSIEGMASGKPFIASDVPGLKEIVNGYGKLFPLGDEKALAEIILKLEKDSSLYQSVAKKCQERAENFSLDKMLTQYLNLYYSL